MSLRILDRDRRQRASAPCMTMSSATSHIEDTMKFPLKSAADAVEVLEYFNWFHDAFIKNFTVNSLDRFVAAKSLKPPADIQCESGCGYQVRIDFAHYNYKMGKRNAKRIIRATFSNPEDILFDLTLPPGSSSARTIQKVEIAPTIVRAPEERATLDLFVVWNVVLNDRAWHTVRAKVLRFDHAQFQEIQ